MDGQDLRNLKSMTTPLWRESERRVAVQQEWLTSIQIEGSILGRWINAIYNVCKICPTARLEPNSIVSSFQEKLV